MGRKEKRGVDGIEGERNGERNQEARSLNVLKTETRKRRIIKKRRERKDDNEQEEPCILKE
jgi:hypothetical protein